MKVLILTLAIITGLTSSYLVVTNIQGQETPSPASPPVALVESYTPQVDTSSQISPDGTKNLVMKTTHNINNTKTIEFTTTNEDGSNRKRIYTTAALESETYALPFNAWSPDNKYIFIFKNNKEALVFKADGEPILEEELYIGVTTIFAEKIQNVYYDETTGWASNTLLIVNSTNPDNTKGPSFWFEVPSTAIIQLSSRY